MSLHPDVVYCVDLGWHTSVPLRNAPEPHMATLHYQDGAVRVQHVCKVIDGQKIIVAPALQLDGGHRLVNPDPLKLTVEPSVLCPDCGLHGFIRDGSWRTA